MFLVLLGGAFSVDKTTDLDAALENVRDGDASLAIGAQGDNLVVHSSDADQVKSAVAQGTLQSFVQAANMAATGQKPTFSYQSERVEDESLNTIQFVTPGLLGWAIAPARTVVTARIAVTVVVAIGQLAIFVGLGVAAFGLRLTGSWWMSFLSGSFFPLRHLNDGMLDVMVRGQGPGAAVVPMLILLAFATVVLFIASRFFSWETD